MGVCCLVISSAPLNAADRVVWEEVLGVKCAARKQRERRSTETTGSWY